MQVFDQLSEFRQSHSHCVATIGKYDGMHLGHQAILKRLQAEAAALSLPALVILSEPQPEEFFAGDAAPPRLNDFDDKVDFLTELGIDLVYRMNFDHRLSQMSAESFIREILLKGLGVKTLIVGDDFRFGKDRLGDFQLLKQSGEQLGFSVFSEEACLLAGERVSSTAVRRYLQQADFEKVAVLLGRPYSIAGPVIKGRQLGRQLGTPTANIGLSRDSLPFTGVYAVEVFHGDRQLQGVANIGFKPTVSEGLEPSLEVYLFDFEEDIYGEELRVLFRKKIRDEQAFQGIEALKEQITADVNQARACFAAGS